MKKVLSLVLTLALVLSSFSMAFADEAKNDSPAMKNLTDIAGNANEEAIGVVSDLGIVTGNPDGTFQPEKAVSRAEYAAMITRALAIPQSALAGYANTSFKDTDGYGWAVGYLAFCNSKGIMLGDGQGNAMPGKTVTLNEAVTMALRAIGYTANSAELKGNWPANYVTKAQELSLYSDLAKDLVNVDKANAAQLIYNILTVQKVAVNSDGKTEFIFDKDKNKVTLLSSGLNCTESEGYVAYTEDTMINIAKYVGQYGKIYHNDDKKVVAFISDSDQLTGRFITDDKFVTTDDEKEYTVKTSYVGTLLKNNGEDAYVKDDVTIDGKTVKVVKILEDNDHLGNNSFGIDGTEFTISANVSGKTIKDIYTAIPWTVTEAKKVKASDVKNIVEDKEILSVKFKKDDNDKLDYTQFQLVGVASLGDIKADDVVYVYKGDKNVRRVEVGSKIAEGVIRSFKKAGTDVAAKFKVGDATFKNASKVVNGVTGGTTIDASNVSDEVKAFLDARGYVFDVEKTKKANNFAVVKSIGDTGISTQVQLLFADGTKKVVNYDKSDVTPFTKATDINDGNNPDDVKYPVIGYSLNKDGEMDSANKYYAKGKVNLGSKHILKFVTDAPTEFGTSKAAGLPAQNDTAKISDDVIVFTVDKDSANNYTDLAVTTIDKVETKQDINAVVLFDENKGSMDKKTVVAMLVFKDKAEAGGTDSYAVVNEFTRDSNADGDKVWEVKGFKDGAKLEALTKVANNNDFTNFFAAYVSPKKGDANTFKLYKVVVDGKGVITKATAEPAKQTIDNATDVDGRKSVKGYAISDKAVFYEVTSDDEFRVTSADLKEGDKVVLFETDDDADGYDVVIFSRP